MTDTAPSVRQTRAQRRAVAAFLLILTVLLSTCWTVVAAVVAPIVPSGGWLVLAAAIGLTIIPLATLMVGRSVGAYPGAAVRLLVFRPFWYAQFLVLLIAITSTLGAIAGAPFGASDVVAGWALAGTVVVFVALALVGYVGSRRLEVRRLVATLPGLPAGLDGLVIAQISDLHVGPHLSRAWLDRVARAVRAAAPDLIAVTGDLIDDFPQDVGRYAAAFDSLRAPLGVYVVPGNHEVYAGWPAVHARLATLPVTVLVNRGVVVERNGARLAVIGTGDPAFGPGSGGDAGPDIGAALREVPPGTTVLALAHNPMLWPALAARGVHLTLSGHTHWGQLAFPRLGWSLASPFLTLAMGWHVQGGSLLYIHPGTGYWGMPLRIGQSSQVAVIELRAGTEVGCDSR